jgi:HSP20 family protein
MSIRRNPFRELERMFEQMSRQFEEASGQWEDRPFDFGFTSGESMSVDVADRGETFEVTADLPGFSKDDISVTVKDTRLTIAAESETEAEESEEDYLRRERSRRSMSRSVTLPDPVDESAVAATYRNGVLTVTLPKREAVDTGTHIEVE